MKRKFACVGFPYLFGMLAFSTGWGKYNYVIIALALIWTASALVCLRGFKFYILTMSLSFFIGLCYGTIYTDIHYNKVMEFDGEVITINGYVKDYKYTSSDKGLITVKGKINDGVTTQISFFVPHNDFDYYEEVKITGAVRKIKDNVDFQEEQYYRAKGVFLKGDNIENVERTGSNRNVIFKALKDYRDYMFKIIKNNTDDREGSFLAAMLCGDKSGLEQGTKAELYRVGIGHIFSVSGTHLVIIASFFGALFRYLYIGHKLRFVFMEIVVWGFVVFAGLSPSVIRSAIMITILCAADLFKRKTDCLNTLGLCCILLTMGNPYSVRDSSFLLSMAGVFALGVVAPKIVGCVKFKGIAGKVVKPIMTMVTLMFTAMPVSLWFFNEISLVAPVANLLLLPLCTMALSITVVVVITGGVGFVAKPILQVSELMVKIVLEATNWLNKLRYCYITISDKDLKITVIAICVVLLGILLLIKSCRLRVLSFITALLVLVIVFNVSRADDRDAIRMLIIPDDNSNQTLIFKNFDCIILDNNAKGEHNKAIGRAVEKFGIKELEAVAVNKERYYSANQYRNMYPVPEKVISDFQDFECDDVYFNNSSFQFYEADVIMEDGRYIVEISDERVIIARDSLCLNDKKYFIGEIDFPVEILYNEKSFEVRGLDYGFNEQ